MQERQPGKLQPIDFEQMLPDKVNPNPSVQALHSTEALPVFLVQN